MTDYNLPYTGLEISDGLTRVVSPDTTPTNASTKAVTSEGIKSALDDKLNTSDIVTNLNSPNDTTVPSSLAVSNAFTMGGINVADNPGTQTIGSAGASGNYNLGWNLSGSDVTTDNTTITVSGAGLWLTNFTIKCENTVSTNRYEFRFMIDGVARYTCRPYDDFNYLTGSTLFNSTGSFTVNLFHVRYYNNAGGVTYVDPRIEFIKLQ